MSIILRTPLEVMCQIAEFARQKRLSLNLSQQSLSERSGVSLSVIKKFERTGKISLESLLKLALVLEVLQDFEDLFAEKPPSAFATMDALLADKTRKRGRR